MCYFAFPRVNCHDCRITCSLYLVKTIRRFAHLDGREFRELVRQIHAVDIVIVVVHRQQGAVGFHAGAAHVRVTDFHAHGCAVILEYGLVVTITVNDRATQTYAFHISRLRRVFLQSTLPDICHRRPLASDSSYRSARRLSQKVSPCTNALSTSIAFKRKLVLHYAMDIEDCELDINRDYPTAEF